MTENAGGHAEIVDGNALAGMLSGMARTDPTLWVIGCGHCRRRAMLADAVVELCETTATARCRTCRHTLLVVDSTADGTVLRIGSLDIAATES